MDENFGVNVEFNQDEEFGVPNDFDRDREFGVDVEENIDDYSPAVGDTFDKAEYSLAKYSKCAMWCNQNNATIEDKGEYYECVALPQPSEEEILAQAKASKIIQLKTARDNEELSPVSYGGYLWDFDEKAQMRTNGAITVLGNNTITWTSADNEEIKSVNVNDLKQVVGAAAMRSNALHIKYRELKAEVEQATTKAEVESVVW